MIIQSMVDISSSGEALVKPKTRGRGEGGGRDGGGGGTGIMGEESTDVEVNELTYELTRL